MRTFIPTKATDFDWNVYQLVAWVMYRDKKLCAVWKPVLLGGGGAPVIQSDGNVLYQQFAPLPMWAIMDAGAALTLSPVVRQDDVKNLIGTALLAETLHVRGERKGQRASVISGEDWEHLKIEAIFDAPFYPNSNHTFDYVNEGQRAVPQVGQGHLVEAWNNLRVSSQQAKMIFPAISANQQKQNVAVDNVKKAIVWLEKRFDGTRVSKQVLFSELGVDMPGVSKAAFEKAWVKVIKKHPQGSIWSKGGKPAKSTL